MILTLEDYFGQTLHIEAPSAEIRTNAMTLIDRVNALLLDCSQLDEACYPKVNSGWRPASYNAIIPNAAPKSKHITGQAIDLSDPEGALDEYLTDHPDLLAKHYLWMENQMATKGWTHLQCVPPRSGNLIFIP